MLVYYHILIFSQFALPILGEKCICMPFWVCNNENAGLDGTCKGEFDVCCPIKCGKRKREVFVRDMIRTRLIGPPDNTAEFGEFPWMLGILYNNAYKCGASLIHPQVALTAAHCVEKVGVYKVRAGEWNWQNENEKLKHQDRTVAKIITHPFYGGCHLLPNGEYTHNSLTNDIALLIMDSPFTLQENIGVVCLPPQNSNPIVQKECIISGWGKTSPTNSDYPTILHKATFPIVSHFDCQLALQIAQSEPKFRLHHSFMCAGGRRNQDTCKGDGGSPLICGRKEDRYEQFGIVSWGMPCGVTNAPGVYANVGRFVDWIDGEMALLGFDSDIYKMSNTPASYLIYVEHAV